ncbi:MAG: hypothetical protein CM1200mP21_02290 [Candidatus Poseidoniales archaeon]|jgi:hypothetical protein|nr:hypothetical protein [Candidatus Thermoplasmatota archaeon]GIS91934.1 MAG: hypothetical protein CM1200mP21_02290 [Candidatus Poseidoniales archaeon]|tara:strand:+ start:930 stop:1532 length:603 start_codon:yes stop_codon:yes gene_type:complete
MFGAATFHAAMAEIVVGSMVLASLCAIGCSVGSIFPNILGGRLSSERMMLTMDKASIAGASLGLAFIPIAALSGSFAADNTVNNALLYNKFVYTGLAAGFWAAFVIGRIRLGPRLWEHRSLSVLQGATATMAILMTTMASSIGGKLVRGESLFDIMPIWLPSDSATVLNPIVSIVLLLVGTGSLFAVFKLGPKAERIEAD